MRRIGGNLTRQQADRITDYLFTQDIPVAVEATSDGTFELWAKDEDQLQRAREELNEFLADPDAPRYRVNRQASDLRRQQEKEKRQKLKLQRKFQPRGAGGGSGSLVVPLVVACVLVSLLTNFGNPPSRAQLARGEGELPFSFRLYDKLTLVPRLVDPRDADQPGDRGPLSAVARGEVWRLITPLLLHGSIMHLVFNSFMLYQLGRITEMLRGRWFMLALFLVGGIVGMFAQAYGPVSLGGSPHVIGASGGVLALFTYLWLRPMVDPGTPFRMPMTNVVIVIGFVVLCMVPGFFPGVANLAHLGGIGTGAVAAAGIFDFLHR